MFAVEVETFDEPNGAQVVPPVAEIVVTALPAPQADAPPYAPNNPFEAESTSAFPMEVTERLVVVAWPVIVVDARDARPPDWVREPNITTDAF